MKLLSTIKLYTPKPRVSYANVVSSMALFLVLTGTAWASSALVKNSVGSKQIRKNAVGASEIKKNAVGASEIRKNAVGSSEIKSNAVGSSEIRSNAVGSSEVKAGAIGSSQVLDNALTGADIDESTLGKVPSAGNADSADTVKSRIILSKRIQASASAATPDDARTAATEVPILTAGQISLYAKCFIDTSSNELYGEVLMRTTANGAVVISADNNYYGNSDFLDVATPEVDRVFDGYSILNDSADYSGDDRGTIIGPDGNGIQLQTSSWLRHGTISGSSPLSAGSDQCYFVVTGDRFGPAS